MTVFNSRSKLFKYFGEISAERKDELDRRKTNAPLLKSYTIETLAASDEETFLQEMNSYLKIKNMDGNIFELSKDKLGKNEDKNESKPSGWLEPISSRYYILYSNQNVNYIENLLGKIVKESSLIDSLWLADSFYIGLFNYISDMFEDYRFTSLKMDHNTELKRDLDSRVDIDDNQIREDLLEDLKIISTKQNLQFNNRLDTVRQVLKQLREMNLFSVARSISMLRIPGNTGGGIDIYHNGKATNRTRNFAEFRNQLKLIINIYSYLIRLIEEKTWIKQESFKFESKNKTLKGSPVVIEFDESLNPNTFENFMIKVFQRKSTNFKLWGDPIKLSERKYHVYGLDLHLWQEIFLELTPDIFVLVLPEGVCGNTVNRFITSVQHYLTPDFEVYIGDENYENFIEQSMKEGLKS